MKIDLGDIVICGLILFAVSQIISDPTPQPTSGPIVFAQQSTQTK